MTELYNHERASEGAPLDVDGAARTHYANANGIRRLAYARWATVTGGSYQQWLALGKDNPEAGIHIAREWYRAAVAAGLVPAPRKPEDECIKCGWPFTGPGDVVRGLTRSYACRVCEDICNERTDECNESLDGFAFHRCRVCWDYEKDQVRQ